MSVQNPQDLSGLHPTARPSEKRGDIEFAEKDAALRRDVHELGVAVGELLKEQCGEALYAIVESARQAAIERREGDSAGGQRLDELVAGVSSSTARDFVRAFSTYFQVVNTAEQVHRIRRRRDYLKDASIRQPGGVEETLFKLRDSGFDFTRALELLRSLRIVPVFTTHPTAPTRRTILRKHQTIVRRLVDMQNPALTPRELAADLDAIRSEVTAIWQTEENPSEARTVFDELEHTLFFLSDVIYRCIPAFYENVENALRSAYGRTGAPIETAVVGDAAPSAGSPPGSAATWTATRKLRRARCAKPWGDTAP